MATTPRNIVLCAIAFVLLCAGLALAQQAEPAEEQPTTNDRCPVMPDEPIDLNFFVDYQGQRVYLCCRRCKTTFEDDPEAYVANLASFQMPPAETTESLETQPPPPSEAAPDENEQEETESETDIDDSIAEDAAPPEFDAIEYIGRFHPVLVHFPIGLLICASLFELVGLARPNGNARTIVRAMVGVGALGAFVAAPVGLANAVNMDYTGTLSWVFWWHRALGIAVAALALIAWVAVERRARRPEQPRVSPTTWIVLGTSLLVGVAGHFGGALVYGWGHYWPPIAG